MVESAEQLCDTLRQLLESYNRLLLIAQSRRDAMGRLQIGDLHAARQREEHELERLAELEQQRRAVAQRFQERLPAGVPCNVSAIAEVCGEPARTRLLVLAAQIRTAAARWEQDTAINQRIVAAANKNFDQVLRVISGGKQAGMYRANGRHASVFRGAGFEAVA